MTVPCKRFGKALLRHDYERYAIRQRPLLVRPAGVKVDPLLKQLIVRWKDHHFRVMAELAVEFHKFLPVLQPGQTIRQLRNHPLRRHQINRVLFDTSERLAMGKVIIV